MTKQTTLKITGLHCSGCAASVEKALKGIAGVTSAAVNLELGKATVDFDPAKVNDKDLAKAVQKAGFGVG